ncbi:MAG: hypothetical protein L6V93_10175 [Clostridiales bacterium]|nr:MAG: hypothetical protein L6V93_10175 [Clostridiales bacterium]
MCDYGCMGLGSCVKACKFGAISIEKGHCGCGQRKMHGLRSFARRNVRKT